MNLCVIFGNRPAVIKAALLIDELDKYSKVTLIHTGQHYDYNMSGVFFDELKIRPPDYNLGIGSGSHAEQVGQMMIKLEPILQKEKIDKVIVFGDTNSAFAGAWTAAKLRIPVLHVEAGPRQNDLTIPEELNRVTIDHISSQLYAPTKRCYDTLLAEGIGPNRAFYTGDVMLDNFLAFAPKIRRRKEFVVLVTVHRPVNTDRPCRLGYIVEALSHVAGRIVFPMHPRTQKCLEFCCLDKLPFPTIAPLRYMEMLRQLQTASLVVTDSGGLQKEAYFAGVPCICLDTSTPWPETLDGGWNRVVEPENLKDAINNVSPTKKHDIHLFGDGKAYLKIASLCLA